MKAMQISKRAPIETFPLEWREVPTPEPGPGEVRLKISCCAICRTDLHVVEGDLPQHRLPIVPGHQVVGVIDEIGPGCRSARIGERVGVAWLRHTCGRCRFCRRGQENLCESPKFTGYDENGGFAEYAIVPEAFAYAIPPCFRDEEAAPLLCAGIIGYRALRRAECPPGGSLGIFGFGSSAHIVAQIARFRDYRIYVVTRGERHQKLAREMGAEWVGESVEGMPVKLDSIIIFAPAGELVPAALTCLEKGGTLSLAGIYMTDIPSLKYTEHLFYERNIRSVTANTRRDGIELLAEAAQIPIKPHVRTYPLSAANQALCDLKADRIDGTGVLVI